MKKTLIITDMLEDFLNPEGALYCGNKARKIIPFVKKKLVQARKEGSHIIYVCDAHRVDDLEFKMFPKHAVAGSKGAKVIEELKPDPKDIILEKSRYSAFYGTELEKILKEINPDEVEVVGVCTSICVMDTVGDLRSRDHEVTVYKKGVADFDESAHKFALERMQKIYGAKVV